MTLKVNYFSIINNDCSKLLIILHLDMFRVCFFLLIVISFNLFGQDTKLIEPTNTGVNMTVAILSVDSFIEVGDTIVALYKLDDLNYKDVTSFANSNDFGIAGLMVWKGERLAIAIWGNDSTSDKKDGFLNNETINWAVLKNNTYVPIQMIYKVGKNVWEPNGISIIDSLTVLN